MNSILQLSSGESPDKLLEVDRACLLYVLIGSSDFTHCDPDRGGQAVPHQIVNLGRHGCSKQQCLSVWPHLAHDAAHLYKQRMWSQVLSYPGTTTPGGLLNEPPGVIAVIMVRSTHAQHRLMQRMHAVHVKLISASDGKHEVYMGAKVSSLMCSSPAAQSPCRTCGLLHQKPGRLLAAWCKPSS